MRRAAVLLVLCAAACSDKPNGFGVDVEARTNMLSAATRNSIVTARLLVSGAETFQKDIGGVGKAAQSGSFKFRYVPGVHSGQLLIRVDGVDGAGNTVAGGTAPAVNVVDGKAVDAVLTLAVNGNGVTCMAPTDCISGNCVDGFCCDTPCSDVCQSCSQAGLEGVCSPAMMGTDPDGDCAAKVPNPPTTDGGVEDDDGGVSTPPPPTTAPDNVQACAGTCNGSGACTFPPALTSCGSPYCPQTSTVGAYVCDGNGTCGEKDSMCSDYNCNNGACRTTCGGDSDCQSTDFCNLNINQCVPKHPIGTTCTLGDQCQTGDCYSGVCCNTTCGDSTQSCNNVGSVGQCQCTGHPCPTGVACTLFYRDGDGDGQGDNTATLTNGKAIAGCVGDSTPAGYSTNNTDCDDGDPNAFLGQTLYFSTPSATAHTFDYNCDGNGTTEKGIPEGLTCGFCSTASGSCMHVAGCTATTDTGAQFCSGFIHFDPAHPTTQQRPEFTLCFVGTYAVVDSSTGTTDTGEFAGTVPCGMSSTIYTCGSCSTAPGGGSPAVASATVKQVCH